MWWLIKCLLILLGMASLIVAWRHKTIVHQTMHQIALFLCFMAGLAVLVVVYKRYI